MKKSTKSFKSLTIVVILLVLLVNSVASVSAASGGVPGKPPDTPGKPSNTPPGQAKKESPPSPPSDSASSNKAEIISSFSCRINQNPIGGDDTFTTQSRSVSTPSGNTVLKCTGEIPAELVPSRTVIDSGFECFTSLGATMTSRKIFTPSGKVHLICHINGQDKIIN